MPTADALPAATVTPAELASFTRQLGAVLDADVDVLRALRIASEHTGSAQLVEIARQLARYLEDGQELHQAIARLPGLFDPFYVEMTRQGEADGVLGKALLAVADYLDRLVDLAQRPNGGLSVQSTAPPGSDAGVAAATMSTLGVLAFGAGGLWALAAARPRLQ